MENSKKQTIEIKIKQTLSALEKHSMKGFYAETAADALRIVEGLLAEGDTVSHGGSVTLKECGITELLASGKYNYLDRSKAANPAEMEDVYARTFTADAFLTSSNAITEKGELYNVDGNSNRVAAMLFGPKKVIVVAGYNKIVPDIEAAAKRVKDIAAPANCVRLLRNTYCNAEGRCVSLAEGAVDFCSGCTSDDRICCNYVVMSKQRVQGRVNVIIVGEELGY